ncbi:hypothetical protein EB00_02738 [Enterococcus faecium]|uniref:hypothetical protein n=1 Tax=Enterococcus faecium TaxID=1352 RepID=UPI000DE9D1ED|nr:hypothetical protein [Enterococcus faecium]RBT20091.1 hypothetical protein EB00_02738 [Enterococcus faecium]
MDILKLITSGGTYFIPTIILILFFYCSLVFNYRRSDSFKKIFSTPIEKFTYFTAIQIIRISLAIIFSLFYWLYCLSIEKISLIDFLREIKNNSSIEKFILIFIILTIIFLFIINLVVFLFEPLFTKKDYLEGKYFFYAQDCDKTKNNIKKGTSIYIVELINQNDLLCFYTPDKKTFIRIIIPYTSIISININNKNESNIFEYYINFNREFSKLTKRKQLKGVFSIIILEIPLSVVFYFVSGESISKTLVQTLLIPNLIIFLPTIKNFICNLKNS